MKNAEPNTALIYWPDNSLSGFRALMFHEKGSNQEAAAMLGAGQLVVLPLKEGENDYAVTAVSPGEIPGPANLIKIIGDNQSPVFLLNEYKLGFLSDSGTMYEVTREQFIRSTQAAHSPK